MTDVSWLRYSVNTLCGIYYSQAVVARMKYLRIFLTPKIFMSWHSTV